jgi:hypothetical protein
MRFDKMTMNEGLTNNVNEVGGAVDAGTYTKTELLRQIISACGGNCDELPDNLETTLLKHIAKHVSGGTGGGGASSWNDLADKPFGEEVTEVHGDTLTWDGNTDGLVCAMDAFYKVSDVVFTLDELRGSVAVISDGQIVSSEDEGALFELADGISVLSETVVCVSEKAVGADVGGIVFPEAGLYFSALEDAGKLIHVSSFTVPNYTGFVTTKETVKTLDEKFMPTLTSPNGTKFKLTVDDSGAVSAVEV